MWYLARSATIAHESMETSQNMLSASPYITRMYTLENDFVVTERENISMLKKTKKKTKEIHNSLLKQEIFEM